MFCGVGLGMLKRMTVFDEYFSVCVFFVDALILISILLVLKMIAVTQKIFWTPTRVL